MKLIGLLRNSAQKKPDSVAIISKNICLTYSRLLANVNRLAEFLKLVGCKPGVKVAIILGNCIEYFTAFFAISSAGGTIVPLSSQMTVYEITKHIERADISIAITNNAHVQKLIEQLKSCGRITILTVCYDDNVKLQVETYLGNHCIENNENCDVALMVCTSGTTNNSKIVMLTDDQLISNMFIYSSLMRFDKHNIVYCSLLLYHIYSICAQILTHISLADTFVVYDKPFFIRDFFKAVQTHKITISAFVPYMGILMAEFPEPYDYNLESLQYITLSGAKTPKITYQTLTQKFKHIRFINTYGMSEAGSRISIAAPNPSDFPVESVGKPMPGIQVRITDEKGCILPPDSTGEVCMKSSGIMKGYYKQSHLTSLTIVDGWLKSGDIGKLDQNGNLFLVGRKKEIIISGGNNIYPAEIEECLLEHPFIAEAAVVGLYDRQLQEVPCAFVVKKTDGHVDPINLISFCKQRLSSFKVPRKLYFVKEIPKLGISKIDHHKLKQMANEQIWVYA